MGVLLPSTSAALIASAAGVAMSLIPYKKNLYDLSTHGISVSIIPSIGDSITLTKFADDRDAIEISPMEINETSTSYNGQLVVIGKIPKVRVTISLIPHSENDVKMAQLVKKFAMPSPRKQGSKEKATVNLVITQKRMNNFLQLISVQDMSTPSSATFVNGTIVSASAYSTDNNNLTHGSETTASRDGRFVASQYVLEFTQTEFTQ